MHDYCVPVTVHGQAAGQTASATLYVLVYNQASDVEAEKSVRQQLTEISQLLSPNVLEGEFEVGQAMAVTVNQVQA